jgi:hypothetical protein
MGKICNIGWWRMMERYAELIENALSELNQAYKHLIEATVPQTPLPRGKQFRIDRVAVIRMEPGEQDASEIQFVEPSYGLQNNSWWSMLPGLNSDYLARLLVQQLGFQPSRLMHAIRAIEQATQWCRDRRCGRERAAQEILQQQQKSLQELQKRYTAMQLIK